MTIRRNSDVVREVLEVRGKRVIDVGCGDGSLVRLLAGEGARITGIEPNPKALDKARAEPPVADEAYVEGVGEHLPFDDGSADIVVFFNSLHHIPAAGMAPSLAEARRVLKPGGTVFVCEPVAEGPHFELMRPVDDETEVRALAHRALREAPGLEMAEEFTYDAEVRRKDFESLRERHILIDPRRAAIFDEKEAELRALFDELGERRDDGYTYFRQPMRVNVLRRA
jgi:SAM-dependent methyltransferase